MKVLGIFKVVGTSLICLAVFTFGKDCLVCKFIPSAIPYSKNYSKAFECDTCDHAGCRTS